jgi:phosphatidylserine decarboxylase
VPGAVIGGVLALVIALPLAWKWQLGLRRVGVSVVVLAALAGVAVAAFDAYVHDLSTVVTIVVVWALTMAAAAAILAWRFYRDPERTAPVGDGLVVSPADGEVVYVRRSQNGTIPTATKQGRDHSLEELTKTELRHRDAHVIGIAMSFLDVHVNRAPIAGKITLLRHFPGLFGSLRDPAMVFENERATTVIEQDGLQVAVVQIASRLVRQIASYVDEGDEVALGQRIGVIRLGSQVDVVVPAESGIEVLVGPGDRVRAGESVLVELKMSSAGRPAQGAGSSNQQ